MIRDLSGGFVLISKKFWYFGCEPLEIPDDVRPDVPAGQSSQGSLTHDMERALKFIKYIESNYKKGIHNNPAGWKGRGSGCPGK